MAVNRTKILDSAQKFVNQTKYDRAIVEYQKIIAEDPRDVRTLLKIGDAYGKKGARGEACNTYKRVAELYAADGFFLKAVAVHKQILKLDPNRVDVQLDLADMYTKLALTSDALSTYENVARQYAREGDIEGTLDILRRMGNLDPDSIQIRIKYAEALSQAGRAGEAADAFGVGAALLKQQGRMDDYIKVAERLLFHRPNDTPIARELATLYLQRRDAKRALAKLQICFKADPKNIHTLDLLALAFEQLGQTAKTVSVYREMVRLLQDQGEEDERAKVLNRILELDPNDKEARQALAAYAPSLRGSIAPKAPPPVGPPTEINSSSTRMPMPSGGSGAYASIRPQHGTASATGSGVGQLGDAEDELEELQDDELELMEDDDDDAVVMLDEDSVANAPALRNSRFPDDMPEESAPMVEIISPTRNSIPGAEPRRGSIPPDVAQRAQIARLLTECEVFERYGLRTKVIEQLNRVLLIDSRHVEARERLKEAFLANGQVPEAVEQLHALAEILSLTRPADADRYLSEAALLAGDASAAEEEVLFVDENSDIRGASLRPPAMSIPPPGMGGATDPRGLAPEYDDDLGLPAISPQEFERGALHAGPPGEEWAARTRSLAPATPVEETLDEAEFFLAQGLFEEARMLLADSLESFPKHPLLLEKMEEVAEAAADRALSVPPPRLSLAPDQDESFMLAERLAEELSEAAKSEDVGSDVIDAETVFAQFKKGVEETISPDDTDTHYDLGIAYMEMGLFDDAVHEFDLARANPAKESTALTMMGICNSRKGDFAAAVEIFKQGLAAPKRTPREELSLYFELGMAYESLQDKSEALFYYHKVFKKDPSFREVERRIQALENPASTAGDVAAPEQDDIDRAFDDLIAKD